MLRKLRHKNIKALVKDEEFYFNSLLRLPETKKAIFQSRPALYCKPNLFYCQAAFMSFLKWIFLFNIGITYFELSLKKIVKKKKNLNWNIRKEESPCGGWTPCPSEPRLGNVTTGLQGDSSNRLENLMVLI